MFAFFSTRIRNKIALLPVIAVLVMTIFTLIYFPTNKKTELQNVLSEQVTATADLLAFGLGVALDSDRFDAIAEGFDVTKGVGAVSYILIYDNANNFLSAYNPDSIKISESRTDFSHKPVKNGEYLEKATKIRFGKQAYGTLVVGVSIASIDANVRSSFLLLLAIGAGLIVLSILVSLVFSSRIVEPLTSVQNAMNALGVRDLTKHCKVNTADETAQMAESVNTAIDSLRQSLSVTSSGATRISTAVTILSGVSETMALNSAKMADKSQTVSKAISEAMTRIENMKNSSNEVTASIQSMASSIDEMNASLNEVAKNCANESNIAATASSKVSEAQTVMQALGNAANEITTINDVINNIAQQTKLLALNATIEAASAGNAGKGFAVVAQEVKTLAQQTDGATNEIARQIEGIQTNAKNAIEVIAEIASVVDEINTISQFIAAAVEQQSSTISGIARLGNSTSSNAQMISSDVIRWSEEMSRISNGFLTVDEAASISARGAEEIKSSLKELQQLSMELTNTVEQFVL